ncbi:MAG TPA: glycoside hydrolase domain-containing protein, partial [Candidatus Solibacter sp.]|nr:glycoside hydrolase domain-containing protein [Candidatus Solibacter sp.]
VHRVLTELYSNTPAGLPGNDDGGVLSSWVVFAQLGLYPEISGVGGLAVGSPTFPHAVIHLPEGASICIDASQTAPGDFYVQSMRIGGRDYGSPWIPWSALAHGAKIEFELGGTSNKTWGIQPDAMPSFDVK